MRSEIRFPALALTLAGSLLLAFPADAQTGSGGQTGGATMGSGGAPAGSGPAGAPRTTTPPVPAPGSEASSGAGAAAGNRPPGFPSVVSQSPQQAELERKSDRINRTVMRSICNGC
jgi:hypothetical protein